MLRRSGCPACRHAAHGEQRFFAWFVVETYAQQPMIQQLCTSRGMCPAHTRRLLRGEDAPMVMASIYRSVIHHALAHFRELQPNAAPCPACESLRKHTDYCLHTIEDALRKEPALIDDYLATGGYCLPHLEQAIPGASLTTARRLLAPTLNRRAAQLGAIAGFDPDAEARHRLRQGLSDAGMPNQTHGTFERIVDRLSVDACPLCLVCGQAERSYLAWLAAEPQLGADDGTTPHLCPSHLHDLAALDDDAGTATAVGAAQRWMPYLQRFDQALGNLPPRSPLARARRFPGEWRRARTRRRKGDGGTQAPLATAMGRVSRTRRNALRAAREILGPPAGLSCAACHAASIVEQRELDLLLAASRDRRFERAVDDAHGPCVRHLLMARSRGDSAALERVLQARLAILDWELEELSRKRSWGFRHEPAGAEGSAWLRAPALLDGRVYLGRPPPTGPARERVEKDDAKDGGRRSQTGRSRPDRR